MSAWFQPFSLTHGLTLLGIASVTVLLCAAARRWAAARSGFEQALALVNLFVWVMVFLVGLSATTATMRVRIGRILSEPQTRSFLLDIMREAVAVARSLGVSLPADYAEQRLQFADTVPQDMTSSLHHDLEAGRPLEIEWLAGAVVTLGRKQGIPTPLCRAVWDILALHAGGARAH